MENKRLSIAANRIFYQAILIQYNCNESPRWTICVATGRINWITGKLDEVNLCDRRRVMVDSSLSSSVGWKVTERRGCCYNPGCFTIMMFIAFI